MLGSLALGRFKCRRKAWMVGKSSAYKIRWAILWSAFFLSLSVASSALSSVLGFVGFLLLGLQDWSSVGTSWQLTWLTGSQVGDVVINIIVFSKIDVLIRILDDLRVILCGNIMHLMKSAARCQLIMGTGHQSFNHLSSFGISRTGSDGHLLSLSGGPLWTSVLAVPRIGSGRSWSSGTRSSVLFKDVLEVF